MLAGDEASIPKSSGKFTRPLLPWWNYECREARTDRIRAENTLKRIHSIETKIAYSKQKLDVYIYIYIYI